MKKLHVIAPLSALSRRTRLYKLVQFLRLRSGTEVVHLGWERTAGESKEDRFDFPIGKELLLRGGGRGGTRVRLMYVLWIAAVFVRTMALRRTDVVWALGFESAFPALLASKLRGFTVIFDDADRFSLLFPMPTPLRKVVQRLEQFTSRGVALHVVPGRERYDFRSDRFYLLRNMPSEREIAKARVIHAERQWPKAGLVININGWLGAARGMDVALAAAQQLRDESVLFLIAGKPDCREAREMIQLPNVVYLGELSNAEALASYLASDFVFTYYRPDSIINRFAESNKWGDAIMTGTGVVVNEEVETSSFLHEVGAAQRFRYDDVDGLVKWMRSLLDDKTQIAAFRNGSSALAASSGFFEAQLASMLDYLEGRAI